MKPPDFLKNLSAPAQMLFRPMLMISLVLHGVVLMLPMPSEVQKHEPPKKEVRVKIAQLPTTRPSLKTSPQSSSKPNPQSTPEPSLSTPPDRPTRPEPVTTRQEPIVSLLPLPESSSPLQQQSKYKKDEPQQQLTEQPRSLSSEQPKRSLSSEQPKRSLSTEQPKRSLSTEQPRRSLSTEQPAQSLQPNPQPAQSSQSNQQIAQAPSTQQPIQSPQPHQEPTQSPSAKQPTESSQPNQEPAQSPSAKQPTESSQPNQESTEKKDSIGGSYTDLFSKNQDDITLRAVLAQVKQGREDKLQDFKADRDLNKLTEPDKFKDANGQPDTKFNFFQKAVSPLTTQDITSALETQLSSLEFRFDKKGTYGGGPIYEVTKGDFKRYVILAPGKDEQGEITAIIVLQDYPG
jgi:hypothetical protein